MGSKKLIGIGLYTPAEAGRLLRIPAKRISRWLRGHTIDGHHYPALWTPQVSFDDGHIVLGFDDLMEARVADAFISAGVSSIRIRAAIELAKDVLGKQRPLSTNRFRTDGREIFLHVVEEGEDGEQRERLLNLFRRQFEFKGILEPILRTVEFDDDGNPALWWPAGKRLGIVVDPTRSFGQPIDRATSVPTKVLAASVEQTGSIHAAARAYEVPESSIRHSLEFETSMEQRLAA